MAALLLQVTVKVVAGMSEIRFQPAFATWTQNEVDTLVVCAFCVRGGGLWAGPPPPRTPQPTNGEQSGTTNLGASSSQKKILLPSASPPHREATLSNAHSSDEPLMGIISCYEIR